MPRPVNDADNLNAASDRAIKNKVFADNPIAQLCRQVITCRT